MLPFAVMRKECDVSLKTTELHDSAIVLLGLYPKEFKANLKHIVNGLYSIIHSGLQVKSTKVSID